MPRIFDNQKLDLVSALKNNLQEAQRIDISVGYFNLRGWRLIDSLIENFHGRESSCCRLIVGMQRSPQEELRRSLSLLKNGDRMSNKEVNRLIRGATEEFRQQLQIGAPTNSDEAGLRRLAAQLRSKKLLVKLYLREPLHAKLYLIHRDDPNLPAVGFVGSSNLTPSGLKYQGELNVDVLDHDSTDKLTRWFEDRWQDRWCVDISDRLADIIDESWARERLLSPYHVYLKMAYHLSREARSGVGEFRIPADFGNSLFDFQSAAVKIAAHHLNQRGGVLIGDVVGLGKTLMATALARIFQDDQGAQTLIICPKNLVGMWEDYMHRYGLLGKAMSISVAQRELPDERRYRLMILDESHNLRNSEGKRYRAIREYIRENDSRCILLSATPYNKSYLDLSAQLGLFVPRDLDLGIRPEQALKEIGETEFVRKHQAPVRSLAGFEHSDHPDDWRELMRLYLVRRTRSFVKENYAETDPDTNRKYLKFEDGTRSYFPIRDPKALRFSVNDLSDPYAKLYSQDVVDAVNELKLPRYGLGNYVVSKVQSKKKGPKVKITTEEQQVLQGLSRAGKRLMGFCRTNLFKRLESSGPAFIKSVDRHILRNFVFLHALENGRPVPIGPQESDLLDGKATTDTSSSDTDHELITLDLSDGMVDDADQTEAEISANGRSEEEGYRKRAAEVYQGFAGHRRNRFRWVSPSLFAEALANDLLLDARLLLGVLADFGVWDYKEDAKLKCLKKLLREKHPDEKVLIFTQFADTVEYLEEALREQGVESVVGVTGNSENPTRLAHRFSPVSNEVKVKESDEVRVLVSTDVLSEGQNLQDCAIVVNFDLPWAIIQLIQRAGRVDRIGQKSDRIFCYSFLPADGVEKIIRLRERVGARLKENAEVIGADEAFFEDEVGTSVLSALYHEKAGILEDDEDTEVDLASYAYQIWKNATDRDPSLNKTIPGLPDVIFGTRSFDSTGARPPGALVYMKTKEGNDTLAWMDDKGESITQSQLAILQAAECGPDEPALERRENHHDLVLEGVKHLLAEERTIGGALGRPSGARFRTYERLKRFSDEQRGTLFNTDELNRALDEMFRFPLRQSATDTLNRQLRSGVDDGRLAELVLDLRDGDRLCVVQEEDGEQEPRIICSMGLADPGKEG